MAQNKNSALNVGLVRLIGEREERSYQKHGVRIHVGSIAHDERSLICTVFQDRRSLLGKPLGAVEMVVMAENVLSPLLGAGLTPMITAVDWAHAEDLRRTIDPLNVLDPVGLISALREAGLPFPRLSKAEKDEAPLIEVPFWKKALGMFAAL